MDHMSRSQLLSLAKANRFKNYTPLNKYELIELINRGYHLQPEKRTCNVYKGGVGASEDELFQSYGTLFKYSVTLANVKNGYFVRGFNMNGMFESHYIPQSEMTYPTTERNFIDPSDSLEIPPSLINRVYNYGNDGSIISVTIHKPTGWFLPIQHATAFKEYIANIRHKVFGPKPKTLFELAARIVNSHHQRGVYLPKTIIKKLAAYK